MTRYLPWILILYSILPLAAGSVRLAVLMGAPDPGFAPPPTRGMLQTWLLMAHIFGLNVFLAIGAFQLRGRGTVTHRHLGRIAAAALVAGVFAGLWLAPTAPGAVADGPVILAVRLIVGTALLLSLARAVGAIRDGAHAQHRAWMIRTYALALGASTQGFIVMTMALFAPMPEQMSATQMLLGWAFNLAVAEWLIQRPRLAQTTSGVTP